jgi:hypothetical protein
MLLVIKQLQARGIKVIALTGSPAGRFGSVPCGRTFLYADFLRHGLDFSSSFIEEEIVIDGLRVYNGDYPMFYKGILCGNIKNEKGSVLGEFFNCVGWRPKKVIFFDDVKNNVEEVAREMGKRGISYQGYWYRAAEYHAKPPFDRAVAEVQLDYLVHHDTLLTAVEASDLLKKH